MESIESNSLSVFDRVISFQRKEDIPFRIPSNPETPYAWKAESGKIEAGTAEVELVEESFDVYDLCFSSSKTSPAEINRIKARFDNEKPQGERCRVWMHFEPETNRLGIKIDYGDRFFGETVPQGVEEVLFKNFLDLAMEYFAKTSGQEIGAEFFAVIHEARMDVSDRLRLVNEWVQGVKVPEQMWRTDRQSPVKLGAFPAGIIDGLANEIKGYADFAVMAYDCVFRQGYFQELSEAWESTSFGEVMESFKEEKLQQYAASRPDELDHRVAEDAVAVVFLINGAKALASSAKAVTLQAAGKLASLSPELAKEIARYSKLGYEIIEEEGRFLAKKGKEVVEIGGEVTKAGNVVDDIDDAVNWLRFHEDDIMQLADQTLGHTITKHVGKTDVELIQRLSSQYNNGVGSITISASSVTSI